MTTTREYVDFLFHDLETGEDFFVELEMTEDDDIDSLTIKAQEVADEFFANAMLEEVYSAEEAEKLGYDTY